MINSPSTRLINDAVCQPGGANRVEHFVWTCEHDAAILQNTDTLDALGRFDATVLGGGEEAIRGFLIYVGFLGCGHDQLVGVSVISGKIMCAGRGKSHGQLLGDMDATRIHDVGILHKTVAADSPDIVSLGIVQNPVSVGKIDRKPRLGTLGIEKCIVSDCDNLEGYAIERGLME